MTPAALSAPGGESGGPRTVRDDVRHSNATRTNGEVRSMKRLSPLRARALEAAAGLTRVRSGDRPSTPRRRSLIAAPVPFLLAGLMLVAIVPAATVTAKGTPSQDWPMFRNGPAHL